jgi:DNA-binding transcriptional LysR family regulator
MKPTESGEVYLKYARRAVAAEDAMRREVHSAARKRLRRLRVGVSMPRANALLARPIVSFYELHNGCTVELREMSTFNHMHKLFLGDEIDFAVLSPIVPDPNAYVTEVLCHERLVIVASKNFRVPALEETETRAVLLRRLEGVPCVLPSCGSYFDPLISGIIDSTNVQHDVVVRDCSAELALALVKDGLGVSVVPSTWVVDSDGLRTFELADVNAGNVLRYIRRIDHEPSQEETVFMQVLRDSLA